MERDLSLFMDHTENHIVEEVKKQNPAWVTKEGFCHKCLTYFKKQMLSGGVAEGTNLGAGGVRQRVLLGVLGYGVGIGVFLWLHTTQAPKPVWLVLFPIFFMGTLGFFQANRKLCVVIAQKQAEAMRRKALGLLIYSVIVSALLVAFLMLSHGVAAA